MTDKMKVLNLYAGIGGNRKLWKNVDVTAVEINPKYADIYAAQFPKDRVLIGDAHKGLLDLYKEFNFIWASPPCPTHSRIRKYTNGGRYDVVYPDAKLWQEIIFLHHHFKGNWVVENVVPYYDLIIPEVITNKVGRHTFWSNYYISSKKMAAEIRNTKHRHKPTDKAKYFKDAPRQAYRNAVHPELGLHVFNCAYKEKQQRLNC